MAETTFVKKIFGGGEPADEMDEVAKSFTEERQPTAQAHNLHVDFRDGLSSEGVAWSHYARYRWRDEGEHESLRIIFGGAGALEVTGFNLKVLVDKMRQGRLSSIRELVTGQAKLAVAGGSEPVVMGVKTYPDFDTLFEAIKQEGKEEERDTGFAGKVRGR